MNIIINTIPHKAVPTKRPDTANHIAYGSYLVNACGCMECHTQENKGQIIQELAFMGGREFLLPDGSIIRSSNLTPAQRTGIGSWNEDMFVKRFKSYTDSNYKPQIVERGTLNTVMPWTMYGRMTESDLAAIYSYLKSLQPREHDIEKFTPTGTLRK